MDQAIQEAEGNKIVYKFSQGDPASEKDDNQSLDYDEDHPHAVFDKKIKTPKVRAGVLAGGFGTFT